MDKIYDSVYVANYANVKRLHVYFRALGQIKKKGIDYKGAIVCAKWGGKRETVFKLVEYYDVGDILDRYESLNAGQINRVLNQSKCNLLLSLKEGSSRSLFESMLSGTPVILIKKNIGVNKTYINDSTGEIVDEHKLADALIAMKDSYNKYAPREWAMENIIPEVTTAKLVDIIKEKDSGFVITKREMLIKTNMPEVAYLNKNLNSSRKSFLKDVLSLFRKGVSVTVAEAQIMLLSDRFYGKRHK